MNYESLFFSFKGKPFKILNIWLCWLGCVIRGFSCFLQHEQNFIFSSFDFWIGTKFINCSNARFSIIQRQDITYSVQDFLLWHKITSQIAHSGKGNSIQKRRKRKTWRIHWHKLVDLRGGGCACSSEQRRVAAQKSFLLHFLSLYHLPQLWHGRTTVFLKKATPEWNNMLSLPCDFFKSWYLWRPGSMTMKRVAT